MSLFFEDLEVKTEKPTPIFVEDTTGLLSITLESEMAWHNLETSMMKEEFKAVITEDEQQLEKGKGEFFKKIIAFFDGLWKAIVAGIQNLITKLVIQFRNGEKFLASKAEAIKAYKGGKSAEVFVWKVGTMAGINSQFPNGIGAKLKGMISQQSPNVATTDAIASDLGYSSFANLDKDIVAKAHSDARKSMEISPAWLGSAMQDIKDAKVVIGKLKGFVGDAKTLISEGKKAAQEGLKAVEGAKETVQKIKVANTTTAKNATSVLNKIINVFTKLQLERYSDSLRLIKAVVGGAKADAKQLEQGKKLVDKQKAKQAKEDEVAKKKAEKEQAKKESLFDLTLEDFDDEDVDLEDLDLD